MSSHHTLSAVAACLVCVTTACGAHSPPFETSDAEADVNPPPPVVDAGMADVAVTFGDSSVMDVAPKPSHQNLIPNGNFEMGNVLFGSDYGYAPGVNMLGEGDYTVGTSGETANVSLIDAGDHTLGTGLMFIGNGKSTPDNVWHTATSVNVTPNTKYFFEAWVMNLCCRPGTGYGNGVDPLGPAALSFYANGVLIGKRTSMKLGVWEGMSTTWDSGSATTVDLTLVNSNTDSQGNDFAADDIYLGTESTVIN